MNETYPTNPQEHANANNIVEDVTPEHPQFSEVNKFLSEYFFDRGEYETEELIRSRFCQPFEPNEMHAKFFMKAVFDNNKIIGARIHQVILPPDNAPNNIPVVVFLMNILVDENCQKNGIGTKLRQAAEADVENLAKDSLHVQRRVWYVAEMETLNNNDPDGVARYAAYKKSGFRMVDPDNVTYQQLGDPVTNLGKPMQLMVADGLNHTSNVEQAISRTHLYQIVEALKYSYTAVGYRYDDNTEPKMVSDAISYETCDIPIAT